jgi:ADP-dependent phosphofructokinase/glucokinase
LIVPQGREVFPVALRGSLLKARTPAITIRMPSSERFINAANGRTYRLLVQHDLFGDLEIIQCWGSTLSGHGGFKIQPVASAEECEKQLTRQRSLRQRRGYLPVECAIS